MNKLLIIDGNAIVHRAYHAYPPTLTTPDKKPINAVYGWFAMLIKVLEEVKPTSLVVCFDKKAPTFRKQLYSGYQSKRPQMADDLSIQITMLHEALNEIGIPIFEVDGYEADDLIGTLAFQAAKGKGQNQNEENETIILSADKDLLQLVNAHTRMFAPIIGITKFILYDEKTVLEKYGVKPTQVADYKALVGDNSDGYPGINGIGPKTAINLLKQYETFENLYKNLKNLPERITLKLATDAEQGALAKKLATITLDAPVKLILKDCDMNNFTQEKILKVFEKLGFESLKKRIGIFSKGKNDQLNLDFL